MGKISVLVSFVLVVVLIFVDVTIAKHEQEHSKKHVGEIKIYELKKGNFSVKFTNWGATIVSVFLPDKKGNVADVVLGYDNLKDYTDDKVYFGAIVGRVANRIGKAQFTLNGTTYKLVNNEGKNLLHGGKVGFSDVLWSVKKYVKDGPAPYIAFTYKSFDGEQGFPGGLSVYVYYTLYGDQKLKVTMTARAVKKATPVNLAQHTYWNLGGHNSGDILSNTVQLFASHITPTDEALIPTGKIAPVKDTAYDFLKPHPVGSKIKELPKGYDINYVVDGTADEMRKVAVVRDPKSRRKMSLWSNKPGVQFYTGNMLKDVKGKGDAVYGPHAALCLETQGFPDAVNHPNFPSVIVKPGKRYRHLMYYMFSTE